MKPPSFHWGTIRWLCLGTADRAQIPHTHLGKPAKLTETLSPVIEPQLFKLRLLFKVKQTGEKAEVQQFHSVGPKLLQSPSPRILLHWPDAQGLPSQSYREFRKKVNRTPCALGPGQNEAVRTGYWVPLTLSAALSLVSAKTPKGSWNGSHQESFQKPVIRDQDKACLWR